jgi:alcohol dehydrogenase
VALDIDREKLGRARRLGAEAAVDARSGGVAAVLETTGGGAHVSIDALGSTATATASVESLRKRGRHVQAGLMLAGDAVAPVPMARVIAHELSLHGVHGMAVRHYPELLGAVAGGVVDPSLLVGAEVGLEDAGAELEAMGSFTRTGSLSC